MPPPPPPCPLHCRHAAGAAASRVGPASRGSEGGTALVGPRHIDAQGIAAFKSRTRGGQVRVEETACRRPAGGLCGCGSATRGHPSARRTPSLSGESLRAHPLRAVRVGYRKSEAGRRRRTCICGEQQRRGAQSRTLEQTPHHLLALAAPPRPNLNACQEALNVATKVTTEHCQTVDAEEGYRTGTQVRSAAPHNLCEHCLA